MLDQGITKATEEALEENASLWFIYSWFLCFVNKTQVFEDIGAYITHPIETASLCYNSMLPLTAH